MLGSRDGIHWSALASPSAAEALEVTAIVLDHGALVAIGSDSWGETRSRKWVSMDRGATWSAAVTIDVGSTFDVARLPDGRLLAVGTAGRVGLGTSTDERPWVRLGPAFYLELGEWNAIAINGDGRIVVAGTGNDNPQVVTSANGTDWTRAIVPGGDTGWGVAIGDVSATSAGFVAVGPGPGGLVGIWRSTDGMTWEIEPEVRAFEGEPGPVQATSVAEIGGRIVVGGMYPRPEQVGGRLSAATWITPTDGIDAPSESAACPGDVSLVSIANTRPSMRAACFGSRVVTIVGYVGPAYDCECTIAFIPLSSGVGPNFLTLEVYLESVRGANPPRWYELQGHRVRLTGRFNDPTAEACTADDVPPPADPVATCASRFVGLTFEDLGTQ